MAPTRSTSRAVSKVAANATMPPVLPLPRKGIVRRTAQSTEDQNEDIVLTRGKRKAECSPVRNDKVKRSVLVNLTNNVNTKMTNLTMTTTTGHLEEDGKQQLNKKKDNQVMGLQNQIFMDTQTASAGAVSGAVTRQGQNKVTTRATARNANNSKANESITNKGFSSISVVKTKNDESMPNPPPPPAPVVVAAPMAKCQHKQVRRISNEFNKTEESLYMSALEDVSSSESLRMSGNFEAAKRRSALLQLEKNKIKDKTVPNIESDNDVLPAVAPLPDGVEDFDKANWNDPFQVSQYAMDIFNYMKSREPHFTITDYMKKQENLTTWMRSLLVDWMVEVQETFELNHETLYLAVKIVDIYLCSVVLNRERLQLLGAAALFIACKFDERIPPLVEDFLYICDGAYKKNELLQMEISVLRTIDHDLGIPLSYRFLRRYARCAKISMPTLTLARYILEMSLMDYATVQLSDSKLAAAALFMALRLHGEKIAWTATLEYYSGYKLTEFAEIVPLLNAGLHRKPKSTIKTIRSKYGHKIFHEVAKVNLMGTEEIFEFNLDLNISMHIDNESSL